MTTYAKKMRTSSKVANCFRRCLQNSQRHAINDRILLAGLPMNCQCFANTMCDGWSVTTSAKVYYLLCNFLSLMRDFSAVTNYLLPHMHSFFDSTTSPFE